MSRKVQRSPLTDAVLAQLRQGGRPVGDAEQPRNGVAGWIGQPNTEGTNFVAYSVVSPLSSGAQQGPLSDPGEDVQFGYAITSFGVSRTQCEDQADLMRYQLMLIRNLDVNQWPGTSHEYVRRVQTVIVTGYGPVQRMGDTDPHIYGQTDTVSLLTTG